MPNPARRVYLDVCSLCRPFDDQDQMRIRLETDAVHLILSYVRAKKLELVISPAHEVEIAAIGDLAERTYLQLMVRRIGSDLALDLTQARQRAEELVHRQFGPADAAHLAFAEQAGADLVIATKSITLPKWQGYAFKIWRQRYGFNSASRVLGWLLSKRHAPYGP